MCMTIPGANLVVLSLLHMAELLDMEALEAEVVSAEDKLACTLYTLKSNESLYARNLLGN